MANGFLISVWLQPDYLGLNAILPINNLLFVSPSVIPIAEDCQKEYRNISQENYFFVTPIKMKRCSSVK